MNQGGNKTGVQLSTAMNPMPFYIEELMILTFHIAVEIVVKISNDVCLLLITAWLLLLIN